MRCLQKDTCEIYGTSLISDNPTRLRFSPKTFTSPYGDCDDIDDWEDCPDPNYVIFTVRSTRSRYLYDLMESIEILDMTMHETETILEFQKRIENKIRQVCSNVILSDFKFPGYLWTQGTDDVDDVDAAMCRYNIIMKWVLLCLIIILVWYFSMMTI